MMAASNLMEALLAVQREAPTLPKDKVNPHFHSKFTGLDTIVEIVRPLLADNNLVWTALPIMGEWGGPALRYRLIYAPTGEELQGDMPLFLAKQDAQGMGSALTYARRYSMCAVLNLVADDDDDGNAAAGPVVKSTDRYNTSPRSRNGFATAKQVDLLRRLLTQTHTPRSRLVEMLEKAGASDVRLEEGWMSTLSKSSVSSLIEQLKTPPAEVAEDALSLPNLTPALRTEVWGVIEDARVLGHVGLADVEAARMALDGQDGAAVRSWVEDARTDLGEYSRRSSDE